MPEYNYISDEIFTVDDFLSNEECNQFIDRAESLGFDEAPITTSLGPVMRKDIRNNSRVMLDDLRLAESISKRIVDFVPSKVRAWKYCGVNERFRFYRYEVGQQFDWHYDGAFVRHTRERSQLTFMIYLNDEFVGGETSFDQIEIEPKKGMALFFIHHQLHKGQPVEHGAKYVLRTDVMVH